MGNRDKKQAQQDIGAEKARVNTGYKQFQGDVATSPATKTAGEFASTGGVSPLDTEATQGYRNFASTGGVTPDFASNLRARASRVPAATFSALSDRLRRAGASSYAPGLSTAQARLARGSAQASAESSIDAESQLQDM